MFLGKLSYTLFINTGATFFILNFLTLLSKFLRSSEIRDGFLLVVWWGGGTGVVGDEMQLPLLTSPKAGSYLAPLFPATPRSSDFLNVIYDNGRQIGRLVCVSFFRATGRDEWNGWWVTVSTDSAVTAFSSTSGASFLLFQEKRLCNGIFRLCVLKYKNRT